MTKSISVADAKAHFSELLDEVRRDGAEVVVERRGKPIAVIRPYRAEEVRPADAWFDASFGALAGDAEFARELANVVRSRSRAGSRKVDLED